jgi:hypothetical protein
MNPLPPVENITFSVRKKATGNVSTATGRLDLYSRGMRFELLTENCHFLRLL